jgi:putative solute:sodium symporter small subunit
MQGYWRKNVTIMIVLLAIWAFVGLGCGVLFADWLNQFSLGGFPLGFWFAQQGSIIVFIILILIYAILLNRLDNEYAGELGKEKITTTAADDAGEPEE